jgi:uncharacterized protein YciI
MSRRTITQPIHTLLLGSLAVLAASAVVLSAGCAGGRGDAGLTVQPIDRGYTFVYLKTGPNSATLPKPRQQEIFKGHMANMQRLSGEGRLIIAGPFAKPRDPAWRGLFVFATPDVNEAQRLVATDPGVIEGVFVTEIHPMQGPAFLLEAPGHESAMLAEIKAAPVAGSPPPAIRGYAMITAKDGRRASRALADSAKINGVGAKVLWSGILSDTGQGLFVINATNAADLTATLDADEPLRQVMGEFGVDGWFSTASLERFGVRQ